MNNVLLFGAGTQSTGLLLMICEKMFDIEKPDLILFADTGAEPNFVYDYLYKVRDYVGFKYGVFIHTCNYKNSYDSDLRRSAITGERVASPPLFIENGGMIRRQCTGEYKIQPMTKFVKEYFNIGRKRKDSKPIINRIFGISLDEAERMRISTDWWANNSYPLVDQRLRRHEVIDYINHNHPELKDPPRSSCYFCPFHSDNYWRLLKDKHPSEFVRACEIDEMHRDNNKLNYKGYIHKSRTPLRDIDFNKDGQLEIFGECEGYCGI